MVAHLHGERGCERCDASPLGGAPAPAGVEIADVYGARHHEIAATGTADFALPGADGNAGLAAHRGHVEPIVRPMHRLLEPANIQVLDLAGKGDGLAQAPTLIRIDREDEVLTRGFSGDAHAFGVPLR